LSIGRLEIPIGLSLITLTLLAVALVNLFTKQVATTAGIAFTGLLWHLFGL